MLNSISDDYKLPCVICGEETPLAYMIIYGHKYVDEIWICDKHVVLGAKENFVDLCLDAN